MKSYFIFWILGWKLSDKSPDLHYFIKLTFINYQLLNSAVEEVRATCTECLIQWVDWIGAALGTSWGWAVERSTKSSWGRINWLLCYPKNIFSFKRLFTNYIKSIVFWLSYEAIHIHSYTLLGVEGVAAKFVAHNIFINEWALRRLCCHILCPDRLHSVLTV